MQLYQKIQKLRKENNMTQADLADKLYVSRQAVQKWESGITTPDITKLPELAKIFNVTIDYLLDVNDEVDIVKEEEQNKEDKPSHEVVPSKRQRSMLDYLLMIPFGMTVVTGLLMFFLIGGLMVGMCFAFTLLAPVASIGSFIMIFSNLSNGGGAILICIAGIFLGLGLIYPLWLLSWWWLKHFKRFSRIIIAKLKSFKWRNIL